jgi:hypothetical protein
MAGRLCSLCHAAFFPLQWGTRKLCVPTHHQTCRGTGMAKVCFPFAFLKQPFRERKKEGWWKSDREIQPQMRARVWFRRRGRVLWTHAATGKSSAGFGRRVASTRSGSRVSSLGVELSYGLLMPIPHDCTSREAGSSGSSRPGSNSSIWPLKLLVRREKRKRN